MSTAFTSHSVPSSPSVSPSPRDSWRASSKARIVHPSRFSSWGTRRRPSRSRSHSRSPFQLNSDANRNKRPVNDSLSANVCSSIKKSPLNCDAGHNGLPADGSFSRLKNALPSQSELFAQNIQQMQKPLNVDRSFNRNRRPSNSFRRRSRSPINRCKPYGKYPARSSSPHRRYRQQSPMSVHVQQKDSVDFPENTVANPFKEADSTTDVCHALVQHLPSNIDTDQVLQMFSRFNASEACHTFDGWRISFSETSNRDAAVGEMNGCSIESHVISVTSWRHVGTEAKIDTGNVVPHDDTACINTAKITDIEHMIPDGCISFIFEALLQASVEQAWRDIIEAPVFRFLEEWAGKPVRISPNAASKAPDHGNLVTLSLIPTIAGEAPKLDFPIFLDSNQVDAVNVSDVARDAPELNAASSDMPSLPNIANGRQEEAKPFGLGWSDNSEAVPSVNSSSNEFDFPTGPSPHSDISADHGIDDAVKTESAFTEALSPSECRSDSPNALRTSDSDLDRRAPARNKRGRPPGSKSSLLTKANSTKVSSAIIGNPSCSFCGADDDQDQITRCWVSNCRSALHIYCMAPPLRRVPRQWSCDAHAGPGSSSLSTTFDGDRYDDDEDDLREWRPSRKLREQREVQISSEKVLPVSDPLPAHEYGCARTAGIMLHTLRKQSRSASLRPDLTDAEHFHNTRRSNRVDRRRLSSAITSSSTPPQLNSLTSRKKNLQLFRSGIHAWGVRALEVLYEGDLVFEYIGECVSARVADIREKRYERIGIGSSYFFKISDNLIIDATRKGNLARYINHSCTPNCKTKVVTVGNTQRIAIYAKRLIPAGEELCYDYKFPSEPDEDKIPCWCGTKRCRGYLN